MARHADSLSFRDLIRHSLRLLSPTGVLSVIIPSDIKAAFETEAVMCGMSVLRCLHIKIMKNKSPLRCIIELKCGSYPAVELEKILENEDGNRSEWYKNITKDFYIK